MGWLRSLLQKSPIKETIFCSCRSDCGEIFVSSRACHEATPTCMSRSGGFEIISDIQGRWMIEGGIDQPLTDKPPEVCVCVCVWY